MKLIDCYIENFGKLSDFKMSFSDGLNTVKKDNGYGKTTLTVFIKSMLFGLDDTKKIKLEQNDRKHYMPWQGGRCGGSLTFEVKGKKYRIERTFMPKASDDTFTVYDVKSGKESRDYSENIGEELFGIDADGFERTVFLSEANLSGKNENKTVSAKLSNLVGCDGDLSVMDDAVELLEKQRKIYHRRGGAGEIGELKAKRLETERKINDLARLKSVYADEEEKLAVIISELDKLYIEKKQFIRQSKLADEARIRRTYEKQYTEMRKAVEGDEQTLLALKGFFKNSLPTAKEIEQAKELSAESKRIYSSNESEGGSDYRVLSDFFKNRGGEAEFSKLKELSELIASKKKEAEITERELLGSESYESEPRISVKEADEYIKKISDIGKLKKAKKSCHITIPFGIILLILGIAAGMLFTPVAYAAAALGALILIFGIKNLTDFKKALTNEEIYNRAKKFIEETKGEESLSGRDALELIYEIKSEAHSAEARRSESLRRRERLGELKDEIMKAERDACEIIALFPHTDAKTVSESIDDILRKRDIYLALSEREKAASQKRQDDLALAARYRSEAEAFLRQFPTVSDRPFDEINAKLVEYSSLSRSVERMKMSLAAFAKEHGIDPATLTDDVADVQLFPADSSALDAKISELEKSKALAERQCRIISEELDDEDDLISERDELLAKECEYEERLNVILKTQKYLVEAKDLLTSNYLSKTKTAFDKYVSIISKESGEDFHMDTSFAVMKNERGTLRQTDAYSRGTRDLYALAARFALIDSLYEGESPFVILDDPFAYFDDAKLSRAGSALNALSKEKQIIYLTCSSARKI